VAARGTARETPIDCRPFMYRVSPMTRPTKPLRTVIKITLAGKFARVFHLSKASKTNIMTAALVAHLTMFAEIGEVWNSA
jgi:hypothetical protein